LAPSSDAADAEDSTPGAGLVVGHVRAVAADVGAARKEDGRLDELAEG